MLIKQKDKRLRLFWSISERYFLQCSVSKNVALISFLASFIITSCSYLACLGILTRSVMA